MRLLVTVMDNKSSRPPNINHQSHFQIPKDLRCKKLPMFSELLCSAWVKEGYHFLRRGEIYPSHLLPPKPLP